MIRDNEAINLELDRRRMFHNFVTEKEQESRLLGCLEEEMDHQHYLMRIDKLRRQREQLGKDKLLMRLAETYGTGKEFNYESDHVVNPNTETKN